MGIRCRRPRPVRHLGAIGLGMLGILACGCKCAPSHSAPLVNQRVVAVAASTEPAPQPPLVIESAIVSLNRARRFAEARALLAQLPRERAQSPAYRFVDAYLAVADHDGPNALALLDSLEQSLPELAPDVEQLRAEAKLQTAEALNGAAWLDAHGQKTGWLTAARTLKRLDQPNEALTAVNKGLSAIEGNSAQLKAVAADLRWLRAELRENSTGLESAIEDWRWLALEATRHAGASARVTKLLDSSRLKLDPAEQLTRLRRLADAGVVERVDLEWPRLLSENARLASPWLGAQLRGRARQMARTDQLEAARLLELAAAQKGDNATDLRMDAARLYVREGDVERAVALYDNAARLDKGRATEAQFYAARALAMLGAPERGLERYSQFISRNPSSGLRRTAELERALLWLMLDRNATAEPELLRLRAEATKRDPKSLWLHLAGVAAWRQDKRELAAERWQSVVRESPLSMASLFATHRLRELSVETPSVGGRPAPPERGAPPNLSRRTDQLLALGLDELAAIAWRDDSSQWLRQAASNRVALACRAWQKIGYGERGYVTSRQIGDALDTSIPIDETTRWQWDCRYPRPYATLVEEFEAEFHLPSLILYAIMRQESGFDPDIASPVGAIGLLQLLPTTANRIARELHVDGEVALDEPRTNLRLGAAYLRKLLDIFGQNLILAVAAYNAGPQAVALWLRHAKPCTTELFAARIPYVETQKYVERVLSNLLVYRSLSGQSPVFIDFSSSLPEELKVSGELY